MDTSTIPIAKSTYYPRGKLLAPYNLKLTNNAGTKTFQNTEPKDMFRAKVETSIGQFEVIDMLNDQHI